MPQVCTESRRGSGFKQPCGTHWHGMACTYYTRRARWVYRQSGPDRYSVSAIDHPHTLVLRTAACHDGCRRRRCCSCIEELLLSTALMAPLLYARNKVPGSTGMRLSSQQYRQYRGKPALLRTLPHNLICAGPNT